MERETGKKIVKKTEDIHERFRKDTEQTLKQATEGLPTPKKDVPVLQTEKKWGYTHWSHWVGRAVAVVCICVLLGGSTVVAANPNLRRAAIEFFTGGTNEHVPYDKLEKSDEIDTLTTVGSVTLLQNQVLDEHFTASYLSSPNYLDTMLTPSGKKLFYTMDRTGKKAYYQIVDGGLEQFKPKIHSRSGSIVLEKLPGIMNTNGDLHAQSLRDITVSFTLKWQQCNKDILVINDDLQRFMMDDASARMADGGQVQGDHEGSLYAQGLNGDTEWVEVILLVDAQTSQYQYPFLFNIHTGAVKDPIAKVDLSAYDCLTDMRISDDGKTASAKAGKNHEALNQITIDLADGGITEEKRPEAPVEDCFTSWATGEHTVFYAVGTEECMDGFLYDNEKGTTKTLFQGAAWGYSWEDGFADTYVESIGGNYAALYQEPEDKVYLLDLKDGSKQLLKGIPCSHDLGFFWNMQYSMLSITLYTDIGTSRLAFFIPGTEQAWYFDRTLCKGIEEESSSWYGEDGYVIQAATEKGDMHYLYLYEYTP